MEHFYTCHNNLFYDFRLAIDIYTGILLYDISLNAFTFCPKRCWFHIYKYASLWYKLELLCAGYFVLIFVLVCLSVAARKLAIQVMNKIYWQKSTESGFARILKTLSVFRFSQTNKVFSLVFFLVGFFWNLFLFLLLFDHLKLSLFLLRFSLLLRSAAAAAVFVRYLDAVLYLRRNTRTDERKQ